MNVLLLKAERPSEPQPASLDATKYVRRSWTVFAAYYMLTSLATGLGIAVAVSLVAVFHGSAQTNRRPMPLHDSAVLLAALAAAVVAITFVIQLITGPLVFTRDVVCRKCHTRHKVNRVAFFAGRYSRPPRCPCGGKIEPAFLWKVQT